ncbi:MAG: MlaD family protein [Rhodospirillales bacterium]
METRAHFVLVGAFVLIIGAGLLGFIVWLIGAEGDGGSKRYMVLYEGSVTGLREGGAVRLNGVKVGSIATISLDLQRLGTVRIIVDIGAEVPIKTDTVASLELEGLTGGRYILLAGGTSAAEPLTKLPDEPYPIIKSRPSSLDEILQGAPDIIANVNRVLVNANRLLSERNVQNVSSALENLEILSDTLAENRDEIDSIVKRADQALESFDNTAASVERLASLLEQDGQRLIDKADITLGKVDQLADTLNRTADAFSKDLSRITDQARRGTASFVKVADQVSLLISENREAVTDFTSQGLFEFINFLAEARALIGNLKTITTDVERDPSRFFFGNSQQGYEPRR